MEDLAALARRALEQGWSRVRWDYWTSLEWRRQGIAAAMANEHLERLIRDLHRPGRHPTVRLVAGFHPEPYPHAHALVALSRRLRARFSDAEEVAAWLQLWWPHGPVWAAPYDPTKRHPERGGALAYLSRDPGSVVVG